MIASTSSEDCESLRSFTDYYISLNNEGRYVNTFLGLEFVLVGQLLGMLKAIEEGNTPDNPCTTGQVSRVVHGVTIYPLSNH